MPRDSDKMLLGFARAMRKSPSDAERKLWQLVRDRRIGGYRFRRQHPHAGYILDYFCVQAMLAVEVDGDQHGEPEAIRYDEARAEVLGITGIQVVRFWAWQLLKWPDAVEKTILRITNERARQLGHLPVDERICDSQF